MISLLEKYSKVSWLFVILIALSIFYISSLTFPPSAVVTTNINAILYHFFSFFFLAFFLSPALVKGKNKSLIFIAIIITIMYGISDEIHQLFVPGRCCSFQDFLINSAGILSASLIYTFSLSGRKNKKQNLMLNGRLS